MKQLQDLVIFHYHLLPGGVTDVIRLSLQAFYRETAFQSITLVCGRNENITPLNNYLDELRSSHPESRTALSVRIVPELDYLTLRWDSDQPETGLRGLLLKQFGGEQTVWLVHNYHLGKNWRFTKVLLALAEEESQKMIFQIHDFPECGRFANLKILKDHIEGSLYSLADSVRYCVINKRDFGLLKKAGLPSDKLFLLENPLPKSKGAQESIARPDNSGLKEKLIRQLPPQGLFHRGGDIWLYPVRSIRRKNVLEGGFIAALMENPVNLVVTLPGVSFQEKPYSDLSEKAFAEGLIPGFWGSGLLPVESEISYWDMIQGADCIFSSSVQEGFGYMYLNAIVWSKPLIARYLDIMGGFLPLFSHYPSRFYQTVCIPDNRELKKALKRDYNNRFSSVKPEMPAQLQDQLREQLDRLLHSEGIDFSYLSPEVQYETLKQIASDPSYRKECRLINTELLKELSSVKQPAPDQQKAELYKTYGMESYEKAFQSILSSFATPPAAVAPPRTEQIDKSLLIEFARLEYMRLLYR